jgi:hypothetical protein
VNFSDLVTMAQAYNTALAPAGAVVTLAAGAMPWPVSAPVVAPVSTPVSKAVTSPVSTPVFSKKAIAPPAKPVVVKKPVAVARAVVNPPVVFGASKVVEKKGGVRELLTK